MEVRGSWRNENGGEAELEVEMRGWRNENGGEGELEEWEWRDSSSYWQYGQTPRVVFVEAA